MKPVPPTMREKKRYILARVVPHGIIPDGKAVYYLLQETLAGLFGDVGAAEINMSVVSSEGSYIIVKCRRGMEIKLETALSFVTGDSGGAFALRPVFVSGTIAALKRKIPVSLPPGKEGDVTVGGEEYGYSFRSQEKVDLHQKGIKHQKILYFTREDIEEILCSQ
ncbi:Rpp14/Pop5 family protein [Methanoplanus endosymbiosus]|uniref:Ribonuclease P protein component 2 n=1 Tax=Methanoplanus endosymbiosus TaxID=33865 RepID=A0A9E7PN55_9EURY|nr:Rpp14/Pop5 family protein [Methanoplanus endosymbiosus]UUX92019.1 Rpp14/Pop5 family protein [Methanoplanus endosymbiosus]